MCSTDQLAGARLWGHWVWEFSTTAGWLQQWSNWVIWRPTGCCYPVFFPTDTSQAGAAAQASTPPDTASRIEAEGHRSRVSSSRSERMEGGPRGPCPRATSRSQLQSVKPDGWQEFHGVWGSCAKIHLFLLSLGGSNLFFFSFKSWHPALGRILETDRL